MLNTLNVFINLVMFIVVELHYDYYWCRHVESVLVRIRSIADYQFGRGVGARLFSKTVKIEYSKRTGRIRYIFHNGERLATLRPMDGLFSLSVSGAKRIAENPHFARYLVVVRNDVSGFVSAGGDVFAVHVVSADEEIRPKSEVIVVDERAEVLAVGRAVLSQEEMKAFNSGVAVKVRHGNKEG
jgi:predicted RNA-binding protein (TIGR00451 family)